MFDHSYIACRIYCFLRELQKLLRNTRQIIDLILWYHHYPSKKGWGIFLICSHFTSNIVLLKYVFDVSHLATYIFFVFQSISEPGLGARIDPGMALRPFPSSIGWYSNPRPSNYESSWLTPRLVFCYTSNMLLSVRKTTSRVGQETSVGRSLPILAPEIFRYLNQTLVKVDTWVTLDHF